MGLKFTLCIGSLLVCLSLAPAAELADLIQQYNQEKARLAKAPKKRGGDAKSELKPILLKIGALDGDEPLQFLLREMDGAGPETAAVFPEAILLSKKSSAPALLMRGFSKRPRPVAEAILSALGAAAVDLKPSQADILQGIRGIQDPQVKKHAPPVLRKLDCVESAALLVSLAAGKPGSGASVEGENSYNAAALDALRGMAAPAVKEWLAQEAFSMNRQDPTRLLLLAEAAGKLKLEKARPELEKLFEHGSPPVAVAAIEAVQAIGAEPSIKALLRTLQQKGAGELSYRVCLLDAIASAGGQKAAGVLLEQTRAKDPDTRAIAFGSLGKMAAPEALQALVEGLKDPDPVIRSIVLSSLEGKRDKSLISPLIQRLEKEKEQKLKIDVLGRLVALTGLNMDLEAEDWKKWWATEEANFKLPEDRGGKGAGTGIKTIKADEAVAKYFGLEIGSSKKLAFLVDISGSMTESVNTKAGGKAQKIDILKKELAQVLEKLPADTLVNIICFHGGIVPWQKQLHPLSGGGRAEAIKYVKGLRTASGTNVFDTLELSLKDRTVDTIYLLTDGLPTRGRITSPDGIVKEVETLNRARGAVIHCIAFGEESSLLKNLAAKNKGEYRFVNEY